MWRVKKSALLWIDVAVGVMAVVAVSAVLGGPRFTLTVGLRTRSIPLSRPFHQGVCIGTTPAALLLDVDCFFVYVPKLFDTNSFLPRPPPASKIFPDIIVKSMSGKRAFPLLLVDWSMDRYASPRLSASYSIIKRLFLIDGSICFSC